MRRVVTGHTADGIARVLIDGEAAIRPSKTPGKFSNAIWCTDATPADIALGTTIEDMGARRLGTAPPPGGTRFSVNEIAPGASGKFHRTETLDYAIVIAGELEMHLDDGVVVTLTAGDVVVQRGTNHAWINRGSVPVRIAFILIDALPLGIGDPVP